MKNRKLYCDDPLATRQFTEEFDSFYTRFARLYDVAVKVLPFWKRWIASTLPYIQGPRVLEISFGTGYLIAQYARRYETYAIDYNGAFVERLRRRLGGTGVAVDIRKGNVEALPYADGFFDSIVNTMAFTGYPDAMKALSEMHRVLKPGGKLIMVDVDYPLDKAGIGMLLTRFWIAAGDIVRDMKPLFESFDLEYTDQEIGGWGSVHLYLAEKR